MANLLIDTLFCGNSKEVKKTLCTEIPSQIKKLSIPTRNEFRTSTKLLSKSSKPEISVSIKEKVSNNQVIRTPSQKSLVTAKIVEGKKITQNQIIKPKPAEKIRSDQIDPIVKELRSTSYEQLMEKISNDPNLQKIYEEKFHSEDTLILKKENKYKPEVYRPTDSKEVKNLERIKESNRELEMQNRLNKKRYRKEDESSCLIPSNKISYNKSRVGYEEEYCRECLIYHKLGQHIDQKKKIELAREKLNPDKKPTIQKTTQIFKKTKKEFKANVLPINKIQEQLIIQRNNRIYGASSKKEESIIIKPPQVKKDAIESKNKSPNCLKSHKDPIYPSKDALCTKSITNVKNKNHQQRNNNGRTVEANKAKIKAYEQEIKDELGDFIDDDTNQSALVERELNKIKQGYRRNNYSYSPTDIRDDYDDDIMEAGFDEIEREEKYSQRQAEREDEMEELREKMFYSKKKK